MSKLAPCLLVLATLVLADSIRTKVALSDENALALVEARKSAGLKSAALVKQNKTQAQCQAPCGAATVVVSGTQYKIGHGVHYKANSEECLSSCTLRTWHCWGEWEIVTVKPKPLCCRVNECTYVPPPAQTLHDHEAGTWKEWTSGTKLAPLWVFPAGRCTGATCFCCSEKGIPWNGDVNLKCKLAYAPTHPALVGHAFAFTLSFGLVHHWWKHKCSEYCSHYPGYTIPKKAIWAHAWNPSEIPPKRGPADVAVEIGEKVAPLVVTAKELLAKHKQFDKGEDLINEMIEISERLRDALEEGEADGVAPHMDAALVKEATEILHALDKITMNDQLQIHSDELMEAMELGEEGPLDQAIEKLKEAVAHAKDIEATLEGEADIIDPMLLSHAENLLAVASEL